MGERKFRLVNVVTCEVWELDSCNFPEEDILLDMVIDQMLKYNFRPTITKSDQQFIDEALALSGQSPVFCGDIRSLYADGGGDLLLGFSKTSSVASDTFLEANSVRSCGGGFSIAATTPDLGHCEVSKPSIKRRRLENVVIIDLTSEDEDSCN